MGTNIRPEISVKNEYWIEKHRYYELKHFSLQYLSWKKSYIDLNSLSKNQLNTNGYIKNTLISNPVEKCFESRVFFKDRMSLIEDASKISDDFLSSYILKAVTEGLSFTTLKTIYNIPCSRDVYYKIYRKFFYILSNMRK